MRHAIVVLLLLALVGMGFWVVSGTRARTRAQMEAEALRDTVEMARARADSLVDSLQVVRIRMEEALDTLRRTKAEAESAAQEAEARADSLRIESESSGAQVLALIRESTEAHEEPPGGILESVASLLEEHLRQDSLTLAAWKERMDAEIANRHVAEHTITLWRDRTLVAEEALEAKRVECELCAEEAERWRDLANPGILERIRRNIPLVGGGAAVGALLVLIL